jgi:hypothetical protein
MAQKQTKKPAAAGTAPAPFDWSQATATGLEKVRNEDLGVPFLVIVQKGSPEVDKTHKDHATKKVAGCEVGNVVDSLKRVVIGGEIESFDAIKFIPCTYDKVYMEWSPREKGGGMVKAHTNPDILMECQRNEKGQDVLRNGNIIVTTMYFYGIRITDEGDRVPCVIGMSSTQLKKGRQFLNLMMSLKLDGPKGKYTPPAFSHQYLLSTVAESNEKGSWYGWKIERGEMLQDPTIIAECMDYSKRANAMQRTALPPAPAEEDAIS